MEQQPRLRPSKVSLTLAVAARKLTFGDGRSEESGRWRTGGVQASTLPLPRLRGFRSPGLGAPPYLLLPSTSDRRRPDSQSLIHHDRENTSIKVGLATTHPPLTLPRNDVRLRGADGSVVCQLGRTWLCRRSRCPVLLHVPVLTCLPAPEARGQAFRGLASVRNLVSIVPCAPDSCPTLRIAVRWRTWHVVSQRQNCAQFVQK